MTEQAKKKLEAITDSAHKIKERKEMLERTAKVITDVELCEDAKQEIDCLKDELNREIVRFTKSVRYGKRLIDRLKVYKSGQESRELTKICRTILCERYIKGEKWEVIAVHTGYSLRYIYRLHGLALMTLAKKAPTKSRKST